MEQMKAVQELRRRRFTQHGTTQAPITTAVKPGAPEKTLVTQGTPAAVYEVGGRLYENLMGEARRLCLKLADNQNPHIYVVEKADVHPFASNTALNELQAVADEVKNELLGSVGSYHSLKLPCVVFANTAANNNLLVAAKEVKSKNLECAASTDGNHHFLFTCADLCELQLLTPAAAQLLGLATEGLASKDVFKAQKVSADKRQNLRMTSNEISTLPAAVATKTFAPLSNAVTPAVSMYATLLRYARNSYCRGEGTDLGAQQVNKEVQPQQAACSAAVANREIEHVIRPVMEPTIGLHNNLVYENNKSTTVSVQVNGVAVHGKAVTVGGWGGFPHLDTMDLGGGAYIIQYGLGDLREIRGGQMCFPQLHLLCPVGACTVHYMRTACVLHNSLPHQPTKAARIVGTSLFSNTNFSRKF